MSSTVFAPGDFVVRRDRSVPTVLKVTAVDVETRVYLGNPMTVQVFAGTRVWLGQPDQLRGLPVELYGLATDEEIAAARHGGTLPPS